MKKAMIRSMGAAALLLLMSCQTNTVRTLTAVAVKVPFVGDCPSAPPTTSCPTWVAASSAACMDLKSQEIAWTPDPAAPPPAGKDFTIDFDQGAKKGDACDESDTDAKKCKPKKRSDYTFNGAAALVFKYTLAGTDASCVDKKIDPYIIVLR